MLSKPLTFSTLRTLLGLFAQAFLPANVPLQARYRGPTPYRRGRVRGKPQPAGAKLARKAAAHTLTKVHP